MKLNIQKNISKRNIITLQCRMYEQVFELGKELNYNFSEAEINSALIYLLNRSNQKVLESEFGMDFIENKK